MYKMIRNTTLFLSFIFLWSPGSSYGQPADALAFEQLESLQKMEQKPVLVFIHTSWCKYCEAMEHRTFQDQEVKELLEKSFYFVELNAEEERDIVVKGHIFRYRPTGAGAGLHELAQELGTTDGKLSFPTLVFLNPDFEILYQRPGFLTAKDLTEILKTLD